MHGADSLPFWILGILAVLLAGFSKAASGGGLAVLAVPLLSLVVPPPQAAAIMLPLLCLMDLLGIWTYRGKFDRSLLRELLPGALVGIGVGAWVFGVVEVRWIKGLLGFECLVFAIHRLLASQRIAAAPARARSAVRAFGWSAASGFTSTLAHAGGPPLMQYLLPLKIDKIRFVATSVWFFSVVNYVKLVPYAMLGLLQGGNLWLSLLLVPAIPLGYWIGYRFATRVPERVFFGFVNWSLVLTGAKLLYDALIG